MPYDFNSIATRVLDGVLTAQIANPPLNLIDPVLVGDLIALFDELDNDASVRVVIIESADPEYFIPHVDLKQIAEYTAIAAQSGGPDDASLGALLRRISEARQVTIAKVRGRARGAGSELTLACDLSFASDEATFCQPEVGMGTYPGGGAVQALTRRVGKGRAMEIILGGADFTGTEAADYGWINRSMPSADLDAFVDAIARRIARFPADAVRLAKRRINAVALPPKEDTQVDASSFQLLAKSTALQKRVGALFVAGLQERGDTELHLAAVLSALPSAATE